MESEKQKAKIKYQVKAIPKGNAASLEKDKKTAGQVADICEPLMNAEGLELVHVEYRREQHGRILRLYIDRQGGVTLSDCADISRQIGDLVDVSLDIKGAYHLEVTSPGPNRPLGKAADFDRFKGNRAKIRLMEPLEGRKNFQGFLRGLEGENVVIQTDDQTASIPLSRILSAHLINYSGENRWL